MTTQPINDIIAAGMSALLADKDLKQAVLDYLNALTEAAKPKSVESQWNKVWEEVSTETRQIDGSLFRLHLIARYDKQSSIGKIYARQVYKDFSLVYGLFAGDEHQVIYEYVMNAAHYTGVILKAQSCMPEALAAWDATMGGEIKINAEAFLRP